MIRGSPPSVSIYTRVLKTSRWILIWSLVFTLILGLIPISTPPEEFESTGTDRSHLVPALADSNKSLFTDEEGGTGVYFRTHGIPWFFIVTGPKTTAFFMHRFAIDWAFWFGIFVVPLIVLEGIRLTAFYAARGVRAVQPNHRNRKN